jgi:hypothetical protein
MGDLNYSQLIKAARASVYTGPGKRTGTPGHYEYDYNTGAKARGKGGARRARVALEAAGQLSLLGPSPIPEPKPAPKAEPAAPPRPQLPDDHPAVSSPSEARTQRFDSRQMDAIRGEMLAIAQELEDADAAYPTGKDKHGEPRGRWDPEKQEAHKERLEELGARVSRLHFQAIRWGMKLKLWDKQAHEKGLDTLMTGLMHSSPIDRAEDGGPLKAARRLRRAGAALSASTKREDPVTLVERQEGVQVGDVHLLVHTHEAKAGMARGVVHDLRVAQERMKSAGFAVAYEGGTMKIEKRGGNRGEASYDRLNDNVGWNTDSQARPGRHVESAASIVHEFGHRHYYRNLPSRAVEGWDAEVKRAVTVTPEDVDRLADYLDPLASDRAWDGSVYGLSLGSDSAFEERVRGRIANDPKLDPETRAIFTSMIGVLGEDIDDGYGTRSSSSKTARAHSRALRRSRMHVTLQTKTIPMHWTTAYGETSPEEAYAEAFKLYVMRGPRALGQRTRKFFEHISSLRKSQQQLAEATGPWRL